jgi:hypothetical protein
MKEKTLYFASGTTVLGLYILSSFLNNQSINSLFGFAAFAGGIGLVYMFYNRNKIENMLKDKTSNGSTKTNYSIDDCKVIAIDWASKNFDGDYGKSIGFSWNVATSDVVPVFDFKTNEFYKCRLFYTNYGDKNTRIYLFIDATNGEVVSPKPGHMVDEKDPFDSLEEYRLTKRMLPRILNMRSRDENDGMPFDDLEFSMGKNSNSPEVEE